jgi:hypothetical protein
VKVLSKHFSQTVTGNAIKVRKEIKSPNEQQRRAGNGNDGQRIRTMRVFGAIE